jgi:hypothetical protein
MVAVVAVVAVLVLVLAWSAELYFASYTRCDCPLH